MCELALTKAQSEKRKVKSESAKRKRVLTPLEVSRRCTVVPAELVKPPVPRRAGHRVQLASGRRSMWLGGQVCPREVWLYIHVQTVSCDDGRLDPAQDRDLSIDVFCVMASKESNSWV